jgi:hypothetical protein
MKKTHMLRCRSIVSLQRTGSTPPLVDFSRASHLDLFEQPAGGFFQHPARPTLILGELAGIARESGIALAPSRQERKASE